MQLAPPLLKLKDSVEKILSGTQVAEESLSSVFAEARAFLQESVGLFREVEDTLLLDQEGTQKLQLCAQEMDHSLTALDRLEEAAKNRKTLILKEKLQGFLSSRQRCLEFFEEFSQLAARQPIYSPVPVYDAFIKAGIKHLEGELEWLRLRERLPTIMPELHRVQRLAALVEKLHAPPKEILNGLKQGLQGLETGYGAIHRYFDTEDEVALEDGLKLLGSSSGVLQQAFSQAEQFAGSHTKFTSFRPIEEWLRLREYVKSHPEDEIPPPWIGASVSQIYQVWDFILNQAERLLDDPLLAGLELDEGLDRPAFEAGLAARQVADRSLADLKTPEALLAGDEKMWLDQAKSVEKLQSAVETSYRALEHQMEPFRELPGLEKIAGLKEKVKRGDVSPDVLRDELNSQLTKVEELLGSVRNAQDPLSKEFGDLLPIHRSAFIGMLENLEEGDWEAFDSRWEGILTTLPHLANLSRSLRKRLSTHSSTSKRVKCLRCEATNEPTRRVCSSCGANLPVVVQKMQEYTEITDGDTGAAAGQGASPRAVDLLEALVRNVEGNRVSKKDALDALQLLINDLNRQRQVFTKKLLPMMGKDKVLDSYLQYFAQGLGQYFANLMEMHSAIEDKSLPRLQSGLSQSRETLDTIDAMKERIDEALRG